MIVIGVKSLIGWTIGLTYGEVSMHCKAVCCKWLGMCVFALALHYTWVREYKMPESFEG